MRAAALTVAAADAPTARARQLRSLLRQHAWASNAELPNLPARVPLHAAVFRGHEPAAALLLR